MQKDNDRNEQHALADGYNIGRNAFARRFEDGGEQSGEPVEQRGDQHRDQNQSARLQHGGVFREQPDNRLAEQVGGPREEDGKRSDIQSGMAVHGLQARELTAGKVVGHERNDAHENAHRQKLGNLHNPQRNAEAGNDFIAERHGIVVEQQGGYDEKGRLKQLGEADFVDLKLLFGAKPPVFQKSLQVVAAARQKPDIIQGRAYIGENHRQRCADHMPIQNENKQNVQHKADGYTDQHAVHGLLRCPLRTDQLLKGEVGNDGCSSEQQGKRILLRIEKQNAVCSQQLHDRIDAEEGEEGDQQSGRYAGVKRITGHLLGVSAVALGGQACDEGAAPDAEYTPERHQHREDGQAQRNGAEHGRIMHKSDEKGVDQVIERAGGHAQHHRHRKMHNRFGDRRLFQVIRI